MPEDNSQRSGLPARGPLPEMVLAPWLQHSLGAAGQGHMLLDNWSARAEEADPGNPAHPWWWGARWCRQGSGQRAHKEAHLVKGLWGIADSNGTLNDRTKPGFTGAPAQAGPMVEQGWACVQDWFSLFSRGLCDLAAHSDVILLRMPSL